MGRRAWLNVFMSIAVVVVVVGVRLYLWNSDHTVAAVGNEGSTSSEGDVSNTHECHGQVTVDGLSRFEVEHMFMHKNQSIKSLNHQTQAVVKRWVGSTKTYPSFDDVHGLLYGKESKNIYADFVSPEMKAWTADMKPARRYHGAFQNKQDWD